jgi:SAM-dependent methyltransferase
MGAIEKMSTADDDYRASHLAKGGQYDASLAESPFDAYMSYWEGRRLPEVLGRFFPDGARRYLDFACGTGRITAQVAPSARESVGVDISPTMMAQAQQKCPRTQFHLADLTQDDPDLGQFDLITSFRFFGNAQDELREGALRAIAKRLTPDGHLVINSHRNPRALFARFARLTGADMSALDLHLPKLRALLARHGLRIAALQPIGAWMYRSRLMVSTRADDPLAVRREARFGAPMFAPIAPDCIVVAKRA